MSAHGFGLGACVGLWIGSHAGLIFCFCVRRQNSLSFTASLFGKRWEKPVAWRSHFRSATWEEVNWISCSCCHGKHLGPLELGSWSRPFVTEAGARGSVCSLSSWCKINDLSLLKNKLSRITPIFVFQVSTVR